MSPRKTVRSASPAFQWYASDFVSTVASCSAEETGIYILLLAKDWMETGFAFEVGRLARHCKVSEKVFRAAWVHLEAEFPAREVDGQLRHFHPRLEAERVKQAEYRDKQSAKGKASAAARASQGELRFNRGSTEGGTGAQPEGNSPSPSPALATAVSAHARGNGQSNSPSNGTGYGSRYSPRSGGPDDKPVRPYAPAVAIAPPWCAECGDGELVEVADQRRPVRVHATSCSCYRAPAPAPRVAVVA